MLQLQSLVITHVNSPCVLDSERVCVDVSCMLFLQLHFVVMADGGVWGGRLSSACLFNCMCDVACSYK